MTKIVLVQKLSESMALASCNDKMRQAPVWNSGKTKIEVATRDARIQVEMGREKWYKNSHSVWYTENKSRYIFERWSVSVETTGKKKRKAMKPPSYAPSKILLAVVQNLYDYASLASVQLHRSEGPSGSMYLQDPLRPFSASRALWADVSIDNLIAEPLWSFSCDFASTDMMVLASPSALTSSSPLSNVLSYSIKGPFEASHGIFMISDFISDKG